MDISPDNKTIIFELLGDIYSLPIAGGNADLLLGGTPFFSQPRYSPDGKSIIYISDKSGSDQLWLMSYQGENPKQISSLITDGMFSPEWALNGGTEALANRLKNPDLKEKIIDGMKEILLKDETGNDFSLIQFNDLFSAPEFNGKTLEDYMLAKGYPNTLDGGIEAIIDLELAGGFLAIYHEMDEQDIINILKHPESMIETDGDLINPNSNIFPHPRSYGSFPRVLSKYVRQLKILTLEQAIQKMTSMTAMQIRQDDLGKIVSGAYADLIVFDEDEIEDQATYTNSKVFSKGIEYMLINGKFVISKGELTNKTPGRWIK